MVQKSRLRDPEKEGSDAKSPTFGGKIGVGKGFGKASSGVKTTWSWARYRRWQSIGVGKVSASATSSASGKKVPQEPGASGAPLSVSVSHHESVERHESVKRKESV